MVVEWKELEEHFIRTEREPYTLLVRRSREDEAVDMILRVVSEMNRDIKAVGMDHPLKPLLERYHSPAEGGSYNLQDFSAPKGVFFSKINGTILVSTHDHIKGRARIDGNVTIHSIKARLMVGTRDERHKLTIYAEGIEKPETTPPVERGTSMLIDNEGRVFIIRHEGFNRTLIDLSTEVGYEVERRLSEVLRRLVRNLGARSVYMVRKDLRNIRAEIVSSGDRLLRSGYGVFSYKAVAIHHGEEPKEEEEIIDALSEVLDTLHRSDYEGLKYILEELEYRTKTQPS